MSFEFMDGLVPNTVRRNAPPPHAQSRREFLHLYPLAISVWVQRHRKNLRN